MRDLKNITFLTGDMCDAPKLGLFDYIDCCGVLHHLPEPVVGFRALSDALAERGGLGFMVYAPYGRAGVYPLQEAFGVVLKGLPPKDRLAEAKRILARLLAGHAFRRNPHLKGISPRALANSVARGKTVDLNVGLEKIPLRFPKSAAPLIARIDGRTSLGAIREAAGLDPIAFESAWGPMSRTMSGWGQLWYSRLLVA